MKGNKSKGLTPREIAGRSIYIARRSEKAKYHSALKLKWAEESYAVPQITVFIVVFLKLSNRSV